MTVLAFSYFNPHHHAGGDPMSTVDPIKYVAISIHTTTQVVTKPAMTFGLELNDFNPHHHAGGDIYSILNKVNTILFQSTPPRRW